MLVSGSLSFHNGRLSLRSGRLGRGRRLGFGLATLAYPRVASAEARHHLITDGAEVDRRRHHGRRANSLRRQRDYTVAGLIGALYHRSQGLALAWFGKWRHSIGIGRPMLFGVRSPSRC